MEMDRDSRPRILRLVLGDLYGFVMYVCVCCPIKGVLAKGDEGVLVSVSDCSVRAWGLVVDVG